jgi:hypothetical protein
MMADMVRRAKLRIMKEARRIVSMGVDSCFWLLEE